MERVLKQGFNIDYSYNIYFTEGIFAPHNKLLSDFFQQRRNPDFKQKVLVVVDSSVWKHHPNLNQELQDYFKDLNDVVLAGPPLVITGGEVCKNDPQALESIVQAIDEYAVDRHSYVFAIGGGAILDLVGYAAAISHRGIRHVRIPTTVLSQNDSGVGVKNSVNYKGKKNFLGTFTPPVAVFNDYSFLATLDKRSWLAGISEAIKVALIKDLDFYNWIQAQVEDLPRRDSQSMKELIYRCADLHLEHIRNGDPFELGSSRPLDFGHWSAHKLEQLSNFEVLHGEAVAIGLAIDVIYSYLIGNLTESEALSVVNLIHQLGLPVYHPILSEVEGKQQLLKGLTEFQEHLGGRLTVVLLEKLGKGRDYHHIDGDYVLQAIDILRDFEKEYNRLDEVS
ncbi:3-dehydroquinate synthase [Sphingobacterium sp. DK4209]|uniref:3-dehydroquinate synthase n=1 Tax=Sphingobacterium zhuxiongii TaxID=2662364 RepID=A0A5Q0QE32_9SPHI|nr:MULTISPECIES: 3-dehydroquinate synthase [unclassified Sphingobacterium]MVZ66069.1 3-dehydroquinate synthase [Sphingobacterium sp. DK4209]QGA27479.1 3-dehydroquinate synthase [Sphingobacterium sp. dk4302]